MNNPNCGACGMLNSRGFCSLTACRFPIVNELGTWQERILVNKPKPTTNADRIRAMSDEELALYLHNLEAQAINVGRADMQPESVETWLDWLKQEVAESDD